MKAMLPRATISGTRGLTCSTASNLRAPATGTSQRAPTTLFCFPRWPGLDINPRSTGLPVRAWAGSQVATTAATTTSTGAASTWWTSTPSGTGWSAWCAAARWLPWNWAPSRGTSARSTRTPCCGARPTKKWSARCGRATWAWRGGTSRTARRRLRLRKRRSPWSRSNRPPVRFARTFLDGDACWVAGAEEGVTMAQRLRRERTLGRPRRPFGSVPVVWRRPRPGPHQLPGVSHKYYRPRHSAAPAGDMAPPSQVTQARESVRLHCYLYLFEVK